MAKLRLSDVAFERPPFKDGDRVLVRTSVRLDAETTKRIRTSVEKLAGCPVRVLVVNNLDARVTARRGDKVMTLCGPERVTPCGMAPPTPGVANVDCTTVDLQPGDVLEIACLVSGIVIPPAARDFFRAWAGPEVEVLFL